jgi:hypothetical protein
MGSSADIAGGAAIIPMDSSDTINVRNLIVSLPKKTRLWWRSRLRLQIIRFTSFYDGCILINQIGNP